jgi:hypothetical protein
MHKHDVAAIAYVGTRPAGARALRFGTAARAGEEHESNKP